MENKKMMFCLSTIIFAFFTGCSTPQEISKLILSGGNEEQIVSSGDETVAKRFRESTSQNPTAVETAIELSKKHAKLSEEAAVLRHKNQELLKKNQQYENKIVVLEDQLRQTQKELTEANDLLIDMRIELNNWKTDILGFRDEMRNADTEQLKALVKILELLGGEFKTEQASSEESQQL